MQLNKKVVAGVSFGLISMSALAQEAALNQTEPASSGEVTTADVAANKDAPPPTPAAAVEDAVAPAPKPAAGDLSEEVIVTAQKREEKLANVPLSIQAFSPDALTARNITSQLGLSRAVPSLDVGSQAGYATIFLRGIGTEAFLTADPSIASYVDGVYFPFSPTFVQDFSGVQRVEVLKGPQGTLFGRNATGGAISVTSLAPNFTTPLTTVDFTAGRFADFKPRLYTNIPLADNLAVNLSSYYEHSKYYLEGTTDGKPLRDQISDGVRIRLRWDPFEFMDVNAAFVRTHNQGNGAIGQNLNPSILGRALGIEPPANKRSIDVDERLYGVSDTRLYSGQVNFYLPWLDVKVLGSKQHDQLLYNYDFDGSKEPLVSFDVPGHPADIQQSEIQLISNQSQPWSKWLDVTGGFFYFHNIQGFDPVDVTVANAALLQPQNLLDALAATGITVPTLNQLIGSKRLYEVQAQAQVQTRSVGYYLQTTARFTDWVSLTLGGRFQREFRGLYKSTDTVVFGDVPLTLPGGQADITYHNARDANNNIVPGSSVTRGYEPKVTIDFHPFGDDTLLFASWQRAEKAHAYNAFAIYLPPQYIKPERLTAYEIGLRTTLFEGNTHISVAGFDYFIHDLQTQYVSLAAGGALAFQNAPQATSRGVDFDLTSSLVPSLIPGLSVSLNGAYIDAKFGTYTHAAGYSVTTGIFSNNNDFSGNRQTRTPKFSGTVALTKLWAFGDHEFELGSDYYYNSGFFYSASNDPKYEQGAYGLLGAFGRYKYEPWNLGLRIFGTNLTNKFYTQGVISTDFGGVFTVAPPVEYGATVSWEFGS